MLILRAAPGENRVLLRLAPGKGYPIHDHTIAEEVFVLDGIYVDPDADKDKQYGPLISITLLAAGIMQQLQLVILS